MANINVLWSSATVDAPSGTVIDHADVDLLDSTGSVVSTQPGAAGSGLPTSSVFEAVAEGMGYIVRLRNFSETGQFGPDIMSNAVDIGPGTGTIVVTVVNSGTASVV